MSFTETLFGGLLAVVVLYFLARVFKLSYFWSAFLAGAIPFVSYLSFSLSQGFAGDILAIHLVVFSATAGVLGVFGKAQIKGQPMHWAPKILVAFFVSLVFFNAGLLYVSMHGLPENIFGWILPNPEHQKVHTAFPGAVPHDHNNLYEPHLQRVQQQRDLGWNVVLLNIDAIHQDAATSVTVHIKDKEGAPLIGAKVTLSLWRMAKSADDQRLSLTEKGQGNYSASVLLDDPGNWIAEVFVERGKDSYLIQHPLIVAP